MAEDKPEKPSPNLLKLIQKMLERKFAIANATGDANPPEKK